MFSSSKITHKENEVVIHREITAKLKFFHIFMKSVNSHIFGINQNQND